MRVRWDVCIRNPKAASEPASKSKPSIVAESCLFSLYCGNPFFNYPHKAIMCILVGSPYERAYRHFRSAHSRPLNIVIHLYCLVHAIIANMALLHAADLSFSPSSQLISSTATIGLSALLLFATTSSPLRVRLLAVALLAMAFMLRGVALRHWMTLLTVEGVMCAVNIKYGDAKAGSVLPGPRGAHEHVPLVT